MILRSCMKKTVAAVIAVAALFAVGVSSANALETGTLTGTGTINIHKRATATTTSKPGTGKTDDTVAGAPLAGAVFTATMLDTKKVEEGVDSNGKHSELKASDVTAANAASIKSTYGPATAVVKTSAATNADGFAAISGLAFGYYLLEETVTPAGYQTSAPSLITLPARDLNDANGALMQTVEVYPKNVRQNSSDQPAKSALSNTEYSAVTGNTNVTLKETGNLVNKGDKLAYSLSQDFSSAANKTLTYVELQDLVPTATDGSRVLELDKANTKVYREDAKGNRVEMTAGDYTLDETAPNYTWSVGTKVETGKESTATQDEQMTKFIAENKTDNGEANKIVRLRVIAVFTVVKAGLANTIGIGNKADGLYQTTEGTVDPKPSDPVVTPVDAIGLVKTDKDGKRLAGAVFKVAATSEKASAKQFLQANGADIEAASAEESGSAVLSGLRDAKDVDQFSDAALTKAVDAKKSIAEFQSSANAKESRYYRFWVVETKGITGYRRNVEPFAVVLKVTKQADARSIAIEQQGTDIASSTVAGAANDSLRVINVKRAALFDLASTGGAVAAIAVVVVGLLLIVVALRLIRRRTQEGR